MGRNTWRMGCAVGLLLAGFLATSRAEQPHQGGYYTYRYGYNPGYYMSQNPTVPYRFKGAGNFEMIQHMENGSSSGHAANAAAHATEPQSLKVVVERPAGRSVAVDIYDPHSKSVRTFQLQGGLESVKVQEFVVRPGERLVIAIQPDGTALKLK